MARICLITPHHVSFQPRTLREADSLHEAGHDVRVVCRQVDPFMTDSDGRLMRTRGWRLQAVDLRRHGPRRRAWLFESLNSELSLLLFRAGLKTSGVAARAYVRGGDSLASIAASEPADWFIAHTQAALPAAAAAARHGNAGLGFDCEDLLAEFDDASAEIVRRIEREYLPLCDYVSTPSRCVASRLEGDYKIGAPTVLYNVFPLHLAEGMLPPAERPLAPGLRLHWFGQTVGPGRGIEEAVEAIGLLQGGVELHLRGRISEAYRSELERLARDKGGEGCVTFHPLVQHDELIRDMGSFDVGLALESPGHGNYSLTVTNKLFSYMLAGLAVAATDTPGQREVLEHAPSAGFLYPSGDVRGLADGLRRWLGDAEELRRARQAAWDAARERFCWDREMGKLLDILQRPRSVN
jgi:glycosyltransferase involved in cell wall biosynthesis